MRESIRIKFWKVGCADAITIRFGDKSGLIRNLFIDGGYLSTYLKTIKQELLSIQSANQHVDLWIITHTDRDHIGGVEAFLKDPSIHRKEQLVTEYWFNWSTYEFKQLHDKISVAQGINLRQYLLDKGKLQSKDVVQNIDPVEWYGLHLTVLSPDEDSLNKSKLEWKEVESEKLIASGFNDYGECIDALLKQPHNEDTNVWNGGSIAILLERNNRRILFLADSFPSVTIRALKKMGYSSTNRLHVDYIKLSHHGGKRNFNPKLLEIVNCSKFIILANGITHSLPNKWTLAQILGNPFRSGEKIEFYFNDNTEALKQLFAVDKNKDLYNFECIYSNSEFLAIELNA